MVKILVIVLVSIVFVIIFGTYFFIRNEYVCAFLLHINQDVHNNIEKWLNTIEQNGSELNRQQLNNEFERRLKIANDILDKYSYDRMLYSFKPLKLENWFTEEEIEFIKEGC